MRPSDLPRIERKGEKETEIQAAICEYLSYQKLLFWRSNNIPVFSEGRYRAMPKYSMRGIPDILVILPPRGRLWGIEVKRRGGTLSSFQEEFRRLLVEKGGEYTVATSIDDVEEHLKQLQ